MLQGTCLRPNHTRRNRTRAIGTSSTRTVASSPTANSVERTTLANYYVLIGATPERRAKQICPDWMIRHSSAEALLIDVRAFAQERRRQVWAKTAVG